MARSTPASLADSLNFDSPSGPRLLRWGVLLRLAWVLGWSLAPETWSASASAGDALDSRAIRKLFAKPPREYASAPLWVWNDALTEEQIRTTMRDLAGQQVRQVFVHPRPGLMTPYLGPDWFRLWKVALKEAERLDMNVWIYDENSYPSGFAGGAVPEVMPEARGMGLDLRETNAPPVAGEDLVGVYQANGDGYANLTEAVRKGDAVGPGSNYLVGRLVRAGNSPWHGNRSYVNLLTAGVTEKFLEITLGAYDRELRENYGKRIPGVFTDEPNIRPAGGFPWCPDLPERFQERWGYSLLDSLPSLVREVGDWRRVRHNYYATLSALFIERWAKPYYEACDRRGLEFTGHYWDHEWPHCVGVPDNMAMAAWQHRPGIDTLMNQYAENTHAQFGNIRFCREISSIANQLGRERTLVELYGAGGWDLRFEDMKRIADWLQVLGINTLDEHLSYVTLRGARKRDHPQSFSYHEPWWPAYHVHASYMTRLSSVLSQGQQRNPVLVLEPTTTAWMYQGNEAKLKALGNDFFELLKSLEAAQIEYDLGCEDVIARLGGIGAAPPTRHAWASAATLKVGQRAYEVVVIPPHTETLDPRTRQLLTSYAEAGGRILSCAELPARVAGKLLETAENAEETKFRRRWERATPAEVASVLRADAAQGGVSIERANGDPGILFHHRRRVADGQFLFLVNTSLTAPSRGRVRAKAPAVERWDLFTGETAPYPYFETTGGGFLDFELPPSGSLLLFLSATPAKNAEKSASREIVIHLPGQGSPEARRVGPNVLVLDYVDVEAGGESMSGTYFYAANQFVWKQNGVERNPWDSAVQYRDELVRRTFPTNSGFAATYRFTVEGTVPPNLAVVLERPDLYTVTCNGVRVQAKAGDWWLDRAFGRLPIAAQAVTGENVVRIEAHPFTMFHELEPAYVLGDFTLRAAEHGWVMQADRPLTVGTGPVAKREGGWNAQGHPFYAQGVAYRQAFDVKDKDGRFTLSLPQWYGAVAEVKVNGKSAGWITAPPWECDVTKFVKRGENQVEVVVIGTLKNTLGPHHGNHALGSAWPGMFQNGPKSGPPPGAQYATVSYGLYGPIELKQRTGD